MSAQPGNPNLENSSPAVTSDLPALQQRALELWEVDQTSALELGRALIAVRAAMRENHGAFAAWYRENGLDENRVYYCIRRAEGKASTPAPEPAKVFLNRNNLMLAKYAPVVDGMFFKAAVGVGPDGTAVTDGFVSMRVGLPTGNTCTESVALRRDFMTNLPNTADKELVELAVGRNSVSVTTGDITQVGKAAGDFPPFDKIVAANPPCHDNVPDSGVTFEIDAKHLSKLFQALNALNETDERGNSLFKAKISLRPNVLRIDYRRSDGQTFEGLVQIEN